MSVWWYREVTGFAMAMPAWARLFIAIGTDVVLIAFAARMVWSWWRARQGDARTLSLILLGPVATAMAYAVSEAIKAALQEERPCRSVSPATIVACPAQGDWSFPSNHSVIAGAAGAAVVLACHSASFWVVPTALLAAASRVIVGVHYPHDVVAGLALGVGVALLVMLPIRRPLTRLVVHQRSLQRWRWLVAAPRPDADSPAARSPHVTDRRPVNTRETAMASTRAAESSTRNGEGPR
ncbi:phosphatase PAP2 family protein [Amycolatopsis sp. lyj-108]|uniref:phosphatase PAP2 family protein n=1 Tax=Amycolatopsis sp. lyj-108 TaxID=2789286 RepID=UPI00397DB627